MKITHKSNFVKYLVYFLRKENLQIYLCLKIPILSYFKLKACRILLLSIFLVAFDKKSPERKRINFLLFFLDFQIRKYQ